LIADLETAGARVLDPKPRFLDATSSRYVVEAGRAVLYRDDHHLTTIGAKTVLLPYLRESMVFGRE
jgi:hypothetical protein